MLYTQIASLDSFTAQTKSSATVLANSYKMSQFSKKQLRHCYSEIYTDVVQVAAIEYLYSLHKN